MSAIKGRAGHSRFKKLNHPPAGQAWVWFTREMLESPAWIAMPLSARRVVERIMVEHMAHAATANGELVVTYDDFQKCGLRRQSIYPSIRAAVALGWISITCQGRRSCGARKTPSRYYLAWLPACDGAAPTNRWKRISSLDQAKSILDALEREKSGRLFRDGATDPSPDNIAEAA